MDETPSDRARERTPGSRCQEPRGAPVVGKLYDLLLWYSPSVARFPRDLRHTLGARLEDALLDAHGALVDAAYGHRRGEALATASRLIDRARLLTRLAHDLHALDHRRYFHAASALAEIGQMIGGWQRFTAGRGAAPGRPGR